MDKKYEKHSYQNKKLPIIFHVDLKDTKEFTLIHWHEHIEILFFEQGCGEVFIDERIIGAQKGDIVVINSEEIHSVRTIDEDILYSCLIIEKNFCERMGFSIDEQQICSLVKDEKIYNKIHTIKKELEEKNDFYMPAVMSKVTEILTELYRKYPFKKTKIKKSKNIEMVKSAMSYIKKNFAKNPSVEEIANHTGYSKYYFCRCFKELTGFTVNSYINNVKTEYARELLATNNYSVSQASEMCGFSDISYFTKIFKKHTGVLPSRAKAEKQEDKNDF